MSIIPALGARSQPASLYTATPRNDGKTDSAAALQKSKGIGASPVSLSGDGLDLQKRVASIGNATVDFAQDFVGSFTRALFGDAAKGAVIDFDSASLETSSSYALGVLHSEGAKGTTDAAAFQLSDSSHFIGKGTITTADGRKFDFEVEVQYNYELNAAASQTSDGIDRNTLRSLSLRLLNLVDSKDANTYADLNGADKAKSAYDAQAAAEQPAVAAAPTPAPAPAPAVEAAPAANDAASAEKAST